MAVRRCKSSWMRSALKITETSSRDLVPIDKPVFRFPKQAKQVPELPKMKDPKEFIRCQMPIFGPFLTVIVCYILYVCWDLKNHGETQEI